MSEETENIILHDHRVRWQYKTVSCRHLSNPEVEFVDTIDVLGADGWELVSTTTEKIKTVTGFSEVIMSGILKRPYRYFTTREGHIIMVFDLR